MLPADSLFEGDADPALSVNGGDLCPATGRADLRWTITTPAGGTITRTGPAVSFPTEDSGTYQIRVDLADGDGGTAFRTASVTVANLDPRLRTVTVPTTGYVGHGVVLEAAATDVAGDRAGLAIYLDDRAADEGNPLASRGRGQASSGRGRLVQGHHGGDRRRRRPGGFCPIRVGCEGNADHDQPIERAGERPGGFTAHVERPSPRTPWVAGRSSSPGRSPRPGGRPSLRSAGR